MAACDEPAASDVAPPPTGVALPAVVAPRGRPGLVPIVRPGSGALMTHGPSWSGDGVAMAACDKPAVLTDKTRIHLRSASVQTYTFFTMAFSRFLSICGARGLLALNQVLI
jgi:hypothetical protein